MSPFEDDLLFLRRCHQYKIPEIVVKIWLVNYSGDYGVGVIPLVNYSGGQRQT
jgi:hypothetical protein